MLHASWLWIAGLDHGVGHFRPLSLTRQRHVLVGYPLKAGHFVPSVP